MGVILRGSVEHTVAQKTALMFAHSWKIELVSDPDISYGFQISIIETMTY